MKLYFIRIGIIPKDKIHKTVIFLNRKTVFTLFQINVQFHEIFFGRYPVLKNIYIWKEYSFTNFIVLK